MAGVALLCALTLILPPADPGPAYQLQVVQTQEVIRDVLVNAEVSGEGLHRNSPASALPLSDS